MDIQIGELNSTVHAVDSDSQVTRATVEAVLKALRKIQSAQDSLKADLDTRSIVEQQRGDRE